MKATYTLLPDFSTSLRPFAVKETVRSRFSTDFHFHNECQLVYIRSGSGTRIIGDSIEKFEPGDLTFIGPNVPHVWYSESPKRDDQELSVSLAIFINPEILIESLGKFFDTTGLNDFIIESERGIRIIGSKKELISQILQEMLSQKGIDLMLSFLQILSQLQSASERVWLNESSIISTYSNKTQGRVYKLMHYIHQHFRDNISLEQAASVAGLQVHSFCRFFKNLTHRTFTDFLNEVRINHACRQLSQSEQNITQIAFDSGFSNISYFNRTFKKFRSITPREYRMQVEKREDQMP